MSVFKWVVIGYSLPAALFFWGMGAWLIPESHGAALVLTWPVAAVLFWIAWLAWRGEFD